MNMNMNMKNEKTMLALIVVAALAMVSVAGVALASDQSDAASTVLVNNNQLIDADVENANFNVYVPFTAGGDIIDGEFTMTITSDADYTGTIQFGTYDVQKNKYIPVITLNLEDVSSATIKFTASGFVNDVAIIETIQDTNVTASTTGSITISAGSLQLGNNSYFSGTINAGDATLASENTMNSIITSEGEIYSDSAVTAGAQQYLTTYYVGNVATTGYKTVDATLTIYGEASIGNLEIGEHSVDKYNELVSVVIDKDANVKINADSAFYYFDHSATFALTIGGTGMKADESTGAILNEFGQQVATISEIVDGKAVFTVKAGTLINANSSYTMAIFAAIENTMYYYTGNVSFTTVETTGYTYEGGTYTAVDLAYTTVNVSNGVSPSYAVLSESTTVSDKDIAGEVSSDNGVTALAYNNDKYSLVYAIAYTSEYSNGFDCINYTDYNTELTSTGNIKFNADLTSAAMLYVLLMDKNGALVLFSGTVDDSDALVSNTELAIGMTTTTVSPVSDNGKILNNAIIGSSKTGTSPIYKSKDSASANVLIPANFEANLSGFDVTNTLKINEASVSSTVVYKNNIIVNGTLTVEYSSDNSRGTIDNEGTIDVNNVLTYQVKKTTNYADQISGTINAAAYRIAAASGSNQAYDTYYYTTTENAITAGKDIYLYGTNVILEDIILTGTPTGTTSNQNVITIANNGALTIGQIKTSAVKETQDYPAIAAKTAISAVVTVPSTSKLVTTGNAIVENGQLKIEGLKLDSYNVSADVFMTDATYGIYTDLATALNIAVSGNIVNVRSTATEMTLASNSTLASGVTLNGAGKTIIVDSGITLTVSGIIKIGTVQVNPSVIGTNVTPAGAFIVDNYDKNSNIDTIILKGILTYGSNFDNTDDSASAIVTALIIKGTSDSVPATLNIDGDVKYSGTITAQASGSGDDPADGLINGNISGKMIFEGNYTESLANVDFDITIPGELSIENKAFYVSNATVTGKVTVSGTNGIFYVKNTLVVGTAATDLKTNDNSAQVTATLENDGAYVFVYGTPADNKVFIKGGEAGSVVTTAYYLDSDKSILYATGYAIKDEIGITKIADPEISGNAFNGWYVNSYSDVIDSEKIGADGFTKVYAYLTVKTVSVTVNPLVNGHWVINGNVITSGSDVPLKESDNSIEFVADSTYKIDGDTTILVNGSAMPLGYQPTAGDELSVTANIVKDESVGGMDLVTMLLIVITIVIVIMAIIIALKLMRS
jgi:hypothetical protein